MSLLKEFSRLAGIKTLKENEVVEKDPDFSPEEIKVVRAAVVRTIKNLEKEARDTQRPALTKLYRDDADAYDHILDAILRRNRAAAVRSWKLKDTGCRDHIFDNTPSGEEKKVVAKYFGISMLHESTETKKRDPYSQGMHDYHKGAPCPYKEGSNEEHEWRLGWDSAEYERHGHNEEDEEVQDKSKNGYFAGYGHFSRALRKQAHPTNPFEPGTNEHRKWAYDYELGYNDRRKERSESVESDEESLNEYTEQQEESVNPKNHMGDRTFQTFTGWKKACKKVNPEVWFEGDIDIAQAMMGPKPYKRGETKSFGEWDGAEGSIYVNESEQLDELSKKTLSSYAKKAVDDVSYRSFTAGTMDSTDPERREEDKKASKRQKGVEKAIDKISKGGEQEEETKIEEEYEHVSLEDEQEDLIKRNEPKEETNNVPSEVMSDLDKKAKEIQFKIEHLAHIDPTFQTKGTGDSF
jgi:hypothetical protein